MSSNWQWLKYIFFDVPVTPISKPLKFLFTTLNLDHGTYGDFSAALLILSVNELLEYGLWSLKPSSDAFYDGPDMKMRKILVLKPSLRKIRSSFFLSTFLLEIKEKISTKVPRERIFHMINDWIHHKVFLPVSRANLVLSLIWFYQKLSSKGFVNLLEFWGAWSWIKQKSYGRWFVELLNAEFCSRLILSTEIPFLKLKPNYFNQIM